MLAELQQEVEALAEVTVVREGKAGYRPAEEPGARPATQRQIREFGR